MSDVLRPLALLLLVSAGAQDTLPPAAARTVDFEKDVRPLLEARCFRCHGPQKQKSGLRLDRRGAALRGGDNHGPAIRPGRGAESAMLRLAAGLEKDTIMPPEGKRLSAEEIGLLRAWIDQGAPGLEDASPSELHWSFRPVVRTEPPGVSRKDWPRNPIDRFILARLDREKLAPSQEADRRTLLRRLSYDLTGLPPTPAEADAFAADADPQAFEKLAERLLASPRHGERWARHWLDIVRFAESHGFEMNQVRSNAWPYRDYVIRAFNDDKPYDRFVREQLAGDALGADEATGFLTGGPMDQVKSPDIALTLQQRMDELHDMVSTTGSTFLGLTVGCARCHTHKFDPIPHADYYALQACFAGVQHGERNLKPPDHDARTARADALRAELRGVERELDRLEPLARPLKTLVLDEEAPGTKDLVPPAGNAKCRAGSGRGELDDATNANVGRSYRWWNAAAGQEVFAWTPGAAGRFRVWVSWGCGWDTHSEDARYALDGREILRADQRRFADGTGDPPGAPLWSGFRDAGVHEFAASSRLVLGGGSRAAPVTADVVILQEEGAESPALRASVRTGKNTDRFAPVPARFLRFTVNATTQLEPCIDELEVFTAEDAPRNVARDAGLSASSSLPGHEIHQLAHLTDGRYGNSWSWISNERGRGWVRLEFKETVTIDRAVWSRDREEVPRYNDRLATDYTIEVSLDGAEWRTVASSADRLPARLAEVKPRPPGAEPLLRKRAGLEGGIREILAFPKVYAGKFEKPGPTHLLHRGDPLQKRDLVTPGGLSSFGATLSLPAGTEEQQRRLELARWITDPAHPLTARVIANRLWQHHFGTGIVDTPSDLGVNGGRPTHPELLDWLASELVANGWSLRHLHRLIVTSAAYRQAGTPRAEALRVDAGTRLLWRYPPRRLEAEALRDSILAVSGKLDLKMGGPGFDLFEPNTNYVKVYTPKRKFGPEDFRRMVYQSKPRMQLDDVFGAFDCPDAGQIAPRRTSSTTPLQALNLMNSAFLTDQAGFLADRVRSEAGDGLPAQIDRAFLLAFQRRPDAEEARAAEALVRAHGLAALARALLNANEFVSVF